MGDAENTCRTCGKPSEQEDGADLFPMFTSTEYHKELNMILSEFEIWNLNISENDGLPQKICLTCFDSFCQIHNFRVMCEEAQTNFSELCTGLDIIIKMEPEIAGDFQGDFSEDFEGEQIITIQEHYKFPSNARKKAPPTLVGQTQQSTENMNSSTIDKEEKSNNLDDTEKSRKDEIDELNAEVTEFKKYRCEFCMNVVSFDDPDVLNDHYNVLHSTDLPYLCPKCDKCFESKAKRNTHAKSHYRIMVECDICGMKVKGGKPMLAQHHELHHVEIDRECPTCGKIFAKASLKTFNYHMSWHDDAQLHKCKYCEKKFIQITHLVVHEKSHNGACVYQCHQCGLGFANDELLSEHKSIHEANDCDVSYKAMDPKQKLPAKSLRCKICKQSFRSEISLRLHNKKHGATPSTDFKQAMKQNKSDVIIKPFRCSKCPESFLMHTQMVLHLKHHDENKPYKCSECSKRFKKDRYLRAHVDTVHLKKKDYICSECGWAFMYKLSLEEHIAAKHSNIKDFKCDVCEKAFAFEKALKNHMLKHKEKKPFECMVCNKSFKLPANLKAHVKTHQKSISIAEKHALELLEKIHTKK